MIGENEVFNDRTILTKESLPKEKHELITHFQEIVGALDYDESIKIMVENNWDLEQAVHKIMDIPIPTETPTESFRPAGFQDLPNSVRRRNTNVNTQVEVNNHKVIKYRHNLRSPWYWQMLSIIWSPFQKLFDMFYYLFSAFQPDPRLRIVDPTSDVRLFISQLEVPPSSSLPNFIQRPYGECLADAKDNLQFLVVYLHDNTNECAAMVRDVLCSEKFKRLLDEENILLWGCSVQSPEGFRVGRILRQSCYPFIGCIGLQSNNKMALLARIEGAFKCDDLVTNLRQVLHNNEAAMAVARADREERTVNQHLRLQQDMDYAESLRVDREKDQLVQTMREKETREEQQKLKEVLKEVRLREERERICDQVRHSLPPEAEDVEDTLLVRIQLPSGQVSRRFYVDDSLKLLFYVVRSQPSAPWLFDIISNFPKRLWPVTPSHLEYGDGEITRQPRRDLNDPPSFKEFGMTTNITLMIIDNEA